MSKTRLFLWLSFALLLITGCSSSEETVIELEGQFISPPHDSIGTYFTFFVEDSVSDTYSNSRYEKVGEVDSYEAEVYHIDMDENTDVYLPGEETAVTADEFYSEKARRLQLPQHVTVTFAEPVEREVQSGLTYTELHQLNPSHSAAEVHFKPVTMAYLNELYKPYDDNEVLIIRFGGRPGGESDDLRNDIMELENEGTIEINEDESIYTINMSLPAHQQPEDLDIDLSEESVYFIASADHDLIYSDDKEDIIAWIKDNYGLED